MATINGTAADDTINGGNGNDTLNNNWSLGQDTMNGGVWATTSITSIPVATSWSSFSPG
jgi:Ca2+-binding RTX toxin-like protein